MESWENLRGEIRYLWKSIPWKSIDNFINFVHIWKQKYSMAYLYVPNVPATYEISIDLYCMCKNITISAINEPDKIWPTSMKLGKQPMAWVRSLNFCFVTNVPIIVLISADMNKIWMNSRLYIKARMHKGGLSLVRDKLSWMVCTKGGIT